MGLFGDQYREVKKKGYMIYKKDCILIDKQLYESLKSIIEKHFVKLRKTNSLNLAYYLKDGNGLNVTYSNLYVSPEIVKDVLTPILDEKWKTLKK